MSVSDIRQCLNIITFYQTQDGLDESRSEPETLVESKILTESQLIKDIIQELENLKQEFNYKTINEGTDEYVSGYEAAFIQASEIIENLIKYKLREKLNG